MEPLAVIILTLDEQANLGKAIASVPAGVPVLVIDSGSTDATRTIASERGAEVHERVMTDYASQRNHALELSKGRFRWVFFLDADEEIPPALWGDIEHTIARDDVDGAYVGLWVRVLGHELHHGPFATASVLRLMRPERARFSRAINERVDDRTLRVIRLQHKLLHADAKPLAAWFRKHIRYAEREAQAYLSAAGHSMGRPNFSLRTKAERTAGYRWVYDRLPLFVRPFVLFGRAVVVQGAWLDGLPGLLHAGMQALWYPLMIDLFIYEARRQDMGRSE